MLHKKRTYFTYMLLTIVGVFIVLSALSGYSKLVLSGETANVTLTRNKSQDDGTYASTTSELGNRGFSKVSMSQVGLDLSKTMNPVCSLPAWAGTTTEKLNVTRTICWPNNEINPSQPPYWKVQGMGGNNSAVDGGGMPHDNYLLISMDIQPSQDTAKLQLIDTTTEPATYQDIYLMGDCSASSCPLKLNIHAGGLVWTGRWVYATSSTGVYVFDTQAIYKNPTDGKYYWPKYGKWTLSQTTICSGVVSPKLSTISIDAEASQLIAAEYVSGSTDCSNTNKTDLSWWNLAADGSLNAVTSTSGGDTIKTATSVRAFTFSTGDPQHINGVAAHQGKVYLNDTYQTIGGITDLEVQYKYDSGVFVKEKTILMPATNPESIYLNRCNNTFWTANEGTGTMQNTLIYSYSLASISPEASTNTVCRIATAPTAPPVTEPSTPTEPTPPVTVPDTETTDPPPSTTTDVTYDSTPSPTYSLVVKDASGEILKNTTVLVDGTEYMTNEEGRIIISTDPDEVPVTATLPNGEAVSLEDRIVIAPKPDVNGALEIAPINRKLPLFVGIFTVSTLTVAAFVSYRIYLHRLIR